MFKKDEPFFTYSFLVLKSGGSSGQANAPRTRKIKKLANSDQSFRLSGWCMILDQGPPIARSLEETKERERRPDYAQM